MTHKLNGFEPHDKSFKLMFYQKGVAVNASQKMAKATRIEQVSGDLESTVLPLYYALIRWGRQDSNLRPLDY